MHIIYHCYGGNHSSVTAAYIHLGLLPSTNIPRIKDLIALKQFDKQKSADIGKIIFIGTDEKNNHVYVLGRKNHPDIIQNVFHELATCFNINNYLLVDVGQYITPFMRIGGFLSRKFGLIQLGRPIVAKGTMPVSYTHL